MAKNLYERRLARAAKHRPGPTQEELRAIVVNRARIFTKEWLKTDGWSKLCESKAMLLHMALKKFDERGERYAKPEGVTK